MKKTVLILSFVIILIGGLWLVTTKTKKSTLTPTPSNQSSSTKIQVVTTLFPLYDFAKQIGKDKVEVTLLLPPGAEAHSFEPKPADILKINNANLFIYTGDFMEPWAKKILNGTDNKKLTALNASQNISIIKLDNSHDQKHQHNHEQTKIENEHEHKHEYNDNHSIDPHIWLNFHNAQIITNSITQALIKIQPENKNFFEENSKKYIAELEKLDQTYQQQLADCPTKKIIYGGHYAFGYLANRYNLDYIAAQGFSPESEPTAQDLAKLTEQVKKEQLHHIFYEELENPKIAEIIAKETGAELLSLNSAHNVSKKDLADNISFISIMQKNLTNLIKGLNCSNQK